MTENTTNDETATAATGSPSPASDPTVVPLRPDAPAPTGDGNPARLRIGIVGYTATRRHSPFGDPEWELWGLNNLHLHPDVNPRDFGAWFNLHDLDTIRGDAEHDAWLRAGADGLPVFVWRPQPEWPTSVAFPTQAVLDSFPSYFTNSVAWMVAFAIMLLTERAEAAGVPLSECELGVWGIDMATDSEYASQRPSCELFLGIAMGAGIKVTLPDGTDLLKAATLYGAEKSPMLAKFDERETELRSKMEQLQADHARLTGELRRIEADLNAGTGALQTIAYFKGVWFQPDRPAANSTHASSALTAGA